MNARAQNAGGGPDHVSVLAGESGFNQICNAPTDRFTSHRASPQDRFGSHSDALFPVLFLVTSGRGISRSLTLLEGRIALSGDGNAGDYPPSALLDSTTAEVGSPTEDVRLSVDLIDPVPGSVLTTSPPSVVIEFNRPIDPDSTVEHDDVEIVQTDSGGNAMSYPVLDQPILDQSATRLSVNSVP